MISHSSRVFIGRILRKVLIPLISPKKKLPFLYRLTAFEGSTEVELLHLHQIASNRGNAIDVGSNQGLYSYRMAKLFSKVYAFEINDSLTAALAAYNPGNIEIINTGLSSTAGEGILYIPVLNGLPLTGWASLAPNNCPDTKIHNEKPVKFCPLDKFNIQAVSFIKIDVEGHELEVLKGAVETLARSRPILLIEIKEQNRSEVFAFFAKQNYQKKKLEDIIGIKGSEENYFFIPRERN